MAYSDNPNIRRVQQAELDLMKLFVNICDQEHLMYYMIGGTMLGAVRHEGFIPWDDDVDFGMPRLDYEKFMDLAEKYLPTGIKLSKVGDPEWESGDKPYQIRLIDTKVQFRKSSAICSVVLNAWVDIFPLDSMPNGRFSNRLYHTKILFLVKLYNLSRFDEGVRAQDPHRNILMKTAVWICSHVPVYRLLSVNKRWTALDKALRKNPFTDSKYLFNAIGGALYRERFEKDVFGENGFYQFEDIIVRGTEKYDFFLKQLYGDYMTPPPKSERNQHRLEFIQ